MGLQAVITSAQLATMTRLCAAEACEGDAEPYSRLCWRCSRKDSVRIHTPPPPPRDAKRPKPSKPRIRTPAEKKRALERSRECKARKRALLNAIREQRA